MASKNIPLKNLPLQDLINKNEPWSKPDLYQPLWVCLIIFAVNRSWLVTNFSKSSASFSTGNETFILGLHITSSLWIQSAQQSSVIKSIVLHSLWKYCEGLTMLNWGALALFWCFLEFNMCHLPLILETPTILLPSASINAYMWFGWFREKHSDRLITARKANFPLFIPSNPLKSGKKV